MGTTSANIHLTIGIVCYDTFIANVKSHVWITANTAPIKVGVFQIGQKVIVCNVQKCLRPRGQAEILTSGHIHG